MNSATEPQPAPVPVMSPADTLLSIEPQLGTFYSHAELAALADGDLRLLAHILMTQARREKVPE